MKSKDFSEALGDINDKYISEANDYRRKKLHFNWKPLAACVAMLIVFFGIIPFFDAGRTNEPEGVSDQEGPYIPFAFTAYAYDAENNICSAIMHEGENVPVSLFNTENGLKGFVFSYDLTEPGVQTTSVSILTDGVIKNDVPDTEGSLSGTGDAGSEYSYVISEIAGLEMEIDTHYTCYVPQQDAVAPFRLMIPRDDFENNTVSEYHLLIEEAENGYVATIEKIVTHERKVIPPAYH